MALTGFSLPELSEYDPPAAGEGSLDPMGLAALSDRLAEQLVPGVRARMQRIRFVTAMAVGATACETLADELPVDGISTPAICFEWLVIEAFVRRLPAVQIPPGVPGSLKARTVVARNERLSAATYLKAPAVFGFHGVYKPFAVDAGVAGRELEPGRRCAEVTRAWETESHFDGFTDGVTNTDGGRLRIQIRDQVRDALRAGRCTTKLSSWLFGHLAVSLHPDRAGPAERRVLRAFVLEGEHDTRRELAGRITDIEGHLSEADVLEAVRPICSPALAAIVDAVVAYERFAALVDAAFRTLCAVSHSMGAQPLSVEHVQGHEIIQHCAGELPEHYRRAADRMAAIGADTALEERLGEFRAARSAGDLVELLFEHHERVQAAKAPTGKRPWFEPLRSGRVIRTPYGTAQQPQVGQSFVHPIRVNPLRRFLADTQP